MEKLFVVIVVVTTCPSGCRRVFILSSNLKLLAEKNSRPFLQSFYTMGLGRQTFTLQNQNQANQGQNYTNNHYGEQYPKLGGYQEW